MSNGRPAHMQVYSDVIGALPLPGEPMTVDAYEKIRDLLWADVKAREPKDEPADTKPDTKKRGTELHRGGSLADSSRVWTPTIRTPDTIAFGFGRRSNW